MYRFTKENNIIRLSDNAGIPAVRGNRDYEQYLQWVLEGGVTEKYQTPPKTPEEVRKDTFLEDTERKDLWDRLKEATPAQINTWVDANVTNLSQARNLFKAILKLLATDNR